MNLVLVEVPFVTPLIYHCFWYTILHDFKTCYVGLLTNGGTRQRKTKNFQQLLTLLFKVLYFVKIFFFFRNLNCLKNTILFHKWEGKNFKILTLGSGILEMTETITDISSIKKLGKSISVTIFGLQNGISLFLSNMFINRHDSLKWKQKQVHT